MDERPSKQDHITFWRSMADDLEAGVRLIDALNKAQSRLAGTDLAKVVGAVPARLVESGEALCDVLRELPDVFDQRVVAAVETGERAGIMEIMASRIADALEADDLGLLEESVPGTEPETLTYVNKLIRDAVKARASDIHLDPTEDGGGRMRQRIDGVLREVDPPPEKMFPKVIAALKLMGAMDVPERRLPQDGRISMDVEGRAIDLRLSTVPSVQGERLVLRLLDREVICLDLAKIGFSSDDLEKVQQLCRLPSGMVIVNGPTGSGKTTLLYTMLNEINTPERCMITVEDPVEYTFDGLAQIPINPQIGLTFARAIRSVLRQAPDVIMVGELRDLETMEVAIQSALTGHMVFTTLHANTSVGAIQRLLDVGLDAFMINASLQGAISLRLVRILCPECRKRAEPAVQSMPPEDAKLVSTWKDATFYKPQGCKHCAGTGYRGLTAIYEILIIDDRIRQLISDGADMAAVREAAFEAGFKTMMTNGLEKAAQGITSIEEVLRVAPRGTSI